MEVCFLNNIIHKMLWLCREAVNIIKRQSTVATVDIEKIAPMKVHGRLYTAVCCRKRREGSTKKQ